MRKIVAKAAKRTPTMEEALELIVQRAERNFPDVPWAAADTDRAAVRLAEKHVARYPKPSAEAALVVRVVEEGFVRKFRESLLVLRALLEMGQGPKRVRWEIAIAERARKTGKGKL